MRNPPFPSHTYPFSPPEAIPSMRYRWKKMNMTNTGTSDRIDIANNAPHELLLVESVNMRSAKATVYILMLLKYSNWLKKSFQVHMKVKIAVVTRAGNVSGNIKNQYILICPHPSIFAAWSNSRGNERMN